MQEMGFKGNSLIQNERILTHSPIPYFTAYQMHYFYNWKTRGEPQKGMAELESTPQKTCKKKYYYKKKKKLNLAQR